MGSPSDTYRRIYAVVARIPRGRVATYGQIATLAGLPRQARLVGYALNVLPDHSGVPWHRVVNAKGQISPRSTDLGHAQIQAQLLTREGIRFIHAAISLPRHQWRPRQPTWVSTTERGRRGV
jgi:methylated-DNA-protein-cysteine methyltransferase-like protein